jgi:hypothetical protein
VELQSGGELLFCAHHAREHGDKLKEIAVTWVDESDKLTIPTDLGRPRIRTDPGPSASYAV